MERNLLKREINALNYESIPPTAFRWADAEYREYPSGSFDGILKENSYLRDKDFKTIKQFDGSDLYYPKKGKVDVLGEDGGWLRVKGKAKYKDKTTKIENSYTESGKTVKIEGWIKKSWLKLIKVLKPIDKGIKLELQISFNRLYRTTNGKDKTLLPRKFGPKDFLHKGAIGRPASSVSEGTAVELQSETDGYVEFETPKWFRDWCDLKERIWEAARMCEEMNNAEVVSTSGTTKFVKFPFDIGHLRKAGSLGSKEYLLVEIEDADWNARIQVSEAVSIWHYESLLKEHESAGVATFVAAAAKEILKKANTAGIDESSLVKLLSFLQIIVYYVWRGQNTSLKIGTSGKRHPSKFAFTLMCRTSFSSIYEVILNKDEQELFKKIVADKTILDKFTLTESSKFFIDGHGTSKDKPTVSAWLKSIISPIKGKDLLSYSKASADAGGFNGSQAMGRFDARLPEDKIRFEARNSLTHGISAEKDVPAAVAANFKALGYTTKEMLDALRGAIVKPSKDWVSFAETVFKKAFNDRSDGFSGSDLKYDPKACLGSIPRAMPVE